MLANRITHNNIIYFKSASQEQNYFDLSSISQAYLKDNPPPPEILNIGVHGSAAGKIKPHSDIDLYCLCEPNKTSLSYLKQFAACITQKTQRWVDMMVGNTTNRGLFQLNPFSLTSILNSHTELYGKDLGEHLHAMIKNYRGDSPLIYSFNLCKGAGQKLKKALVDLNDYQQLVSKPPFRIDYVDCKEGSSKVIARTISKLILTSCAFANATNEIAEGKPFKFSKAESPDTFKKYFNIDSDLPKIAKEIYYQDNSNVDIEKFINQDAFEWLEIQEKLEKILANKIKTQGKINNALKFIATFFKK